MNEKLKKLIINTILLAIFAMISIPYFTKLSTSSYYGTGTIIWTFILSISDTIIIFNWLFTLLIRCRHITIGQYEIVVYCGLINHYIKVNGVIKDQYKDYIYFSPIELSCEINGKKLTAKMSPSWATTIKYDDTII